jgi:FlaA1/EpsC-like NDP-sugar epimerase
LKRQLSAILQSFSVLGDRVLVVAATNCCILLAGLLLALMLRFDRLPELRLVAELALIIIPVRLAFLAYFNCMKGWWRYTSINEGFDIIKATALSVPFALMMRAFGLPNPSVPYSLYILEPLVSVTLLLLARLTVRTISQLDASESKSTIRIAIIGAGWAARMLERELRYSGSTYVPLLALDDDTTKRGLRVGSLKVKGGVDLLPELAKSHRIEEVWIAIPSASHTEMKRFVKIASSAGLRHKTLPSIDDMMKSGLVSQIREVQVEDLLARSSIHHDPAGVHTKVSGRVVMVTGAAGSIGSELAWQLLKGSPKKLICLDQSETDLFYLERKQCEVRNSERVVYCVADVCHTARLKQILEEHQVEIIFHAAAYKHVPMMEMNVSEAVSNNVYGLLHMLDAAEAANVTNFVMISSDKAVHPTNVMGTTKRICELIVASRPSTSLKCVSVRFGNVLGSNGSVVPVLQEQIRRNAEITITHPDISRYFMTISEAVSLVLQAFSIGRHGDLLVLDMGEPVKILDMAKRLIELNGKTEQQVKIKFVGLRDGEKLYEELFYQSENVEVSEIPKIMRTSNHLQSWNTLKFQLELMENAVHSADADVIKFHLKEIVPEYNPPQMSEKFRGLVERSLELNETESA